MAKEKKPAVGVTGKAAEGFLGCRDRAVGQGTQDAAVGCDVGGTEEWSGRTDGRSGWGDIGGEVRILRTFVRGLGLERGVRAWGRVSLRDREMVRGARRGWEGGAKKNPQSS